MRCRERPMLLSILKQSFPSLFTDLVAIFMHLLEHAEPFILGDDEPPRRFLDMMPGHMARHVGAFQQLLLPGWRQFQRHLDEVFLGGTPVFLPVRIALRDLQQFFPWFIVDTTKEG